MSHIRIELEHIFQNLDHFFRYVPKFLGQLKRVHHWAWPVWYVIGLLECLSFLTNVLNVSLRVIPRNELKVLFCQLMTKFANNHSHLVILTHTLSINSILVLPGDWVARVTREKVDVAGVRWSTALLIIQVLLIRLEKLEQGAGE